MIRVFTNNLPYKLADQLIIEYDKRLSEINYLVSGRFNYYSELKQDTESIKLLLALSIFYKRVITNFDSATKFSSRVQKSNAQSIQLGTYDFSAKEIFKVKRVIISFNELISSYSIPIELFNYLETKEFLKKVKKYRTNIVNNN